MFTLLAAMSAEPVWASLTTALDDGVFGDIVAVRVEQHGELVFEHRLRDGVVRRRGIEDVELHDIRSAGKTLTTLAIAAALADGKLSSLDVPVWPLLGSNEEEYATITVRDLMNMASPLDCDDGRRTPGNEERMYRRKRWREFALSIPLDPGFSSRPVGPSMGSRSIGRFSYCTAGVFLLGQVVETVTHERFDAYVQRRLFDPLGIDGVVWTVSRSGEVQSGGQLSIRPRDLTRIGRLVLNRGEWQGEQVLPADVLVRLVQPSQQLGPNRFYGHLWWYRAFESPMGWQTAPYMSGNGGNVVALFSEVDAVVVVQSAAYNQSGAHGRSFDLVNHVLARLSP